MKKQKKSNKITVMALTMAMCVMLLSATTYAWFKLTNSPSVNSLTLKAGTSGVLEIGKAANGTFSNEIDLSGDIGANSCLRPLTTLDGKTFYKPVYGNDGKVVSIENKAISSAELAKIINKTDAQGGYLVQTEFYLKASTSTNKQIGIKLAGTGVTGNSKDGGTKILNKDGDKAAAAVRLSFSTDSDTSILEPNADMAIAGRENQVSMSGWNNVATIKQDSNYKFYNASTGKYDASVSGELFKITTNKAYKVTMNIWIEGADHDCINDIAGDIMNTQIQFISNDLDK